MELISCRQGIHQYLYVVPGNPWECSYPSHFAVARLGAISSWVAALLITTATTTKECQQAISDCRWLGVTLRAADEHTLELIEYILALTLTQLVRLSYLPGPECIL